MHHVEVGLLSQRGKFGTPIPAITAGRSLFPPSHTPSPNRSPCGFPACAPKRAGGRWGLPRSLTRRQRGGYPRCLSVRVCLSRGCIDGDVPSFATRATGSVPFGCGGLTAGLATQSLPGFGRQFTCVTRAELAWPLIRRPAGRIRTRPRGTGTPPRWETLSDGLQKGSLPALHAILGNH